MARGARAEPNRRLLQASSDAGTPYPLLTDPLGGVHRSPIDEVCEALESEYGCPRHGNLDDPLDELFYIILSTRTRESVFRETYERLRASFPDWNSIVRASLAEVEQILVPAGLGRLKARQIVDILERLREQLGEATLRPLHDMSDADAEEFLTRLPGVSAKVAKCVLMYSLDRPVLPVDTHVHRLAARLGMDVKRRPDTSQELVESAVPAPLRYGFHVNAVAHGRAVCRAHKPRCEICCVSPWCEYYSGRKAST